MKSALLFLLCACVLVVGCSNESRLPAEQNLTVEDPEERPVEYWIFFEPYVPDGVEDIPPEYWSPSAAYDTMTWHAKIWATEYKCLPVRGEGSMITMEWSTVEYEQFEHRYEYSDNGPDALVLAAPEPVEFWVSMLHWNYFGPYFDCRVRVEVRAVGGGTLREYDSGVFPARWGSVTNDFGELDFGYEVRRQNMPVFLRVY